MWYAILAPTERKSTQHRSSFALFERISIQDIGDHDAAMQALNQTPESVSRFSQNYGDAIYKTNKVIQGLTTNAVVRPPDDPTDELTELAGDQGEGETLRRRVEGQVSRTSR